MCVTCQLNKKLTCDIELNQLNHFCLTFKQINKTLNLFTKGASQKSERIYAHPNVPLGILQRSMGRMRMLCENTGAFPRTASMFPMSVPAGTRKVYCVHRGTFPREHSQLVIAA